MRRERSPHRPFRLREKAMSDRVETRSRCAAPDRRMSGWFVGFILLAAGSAGIASGQEAAARPTNSLARYVPRARTSPCCWSSTGWTPQPDAWRATAAYKLLTETKLGSMLEDLAGQGLEMALASGAAAPADQGSRDHRAGQARLEAGGVTGDLGQGAEGCPLRDGAPRRRPAGGQEADGTRAWPPT